MRYRCFALLKYYLCGTVVLNGKKEASIINYYDSGLSPPSLGEGGHRGKYFPRQKGALFTLALFGAKVKAIAA